MNTTTSALTASTPYYVIDTHTRTVIRSGTYAQRNRFRALCDRLDSQYGAVRYTTAFEPPKPL